MNNELDHLRGIISDKNRERETALLLVVSNEYKTIVRLLIERDDILINIEYKGGCIVLILTILKNHDAIVRHLIIRNDVDVNTQDNKIKRPCALRYHLL